MVHTPRSPAGVPSTPKAIQDPSGDTEKASASSRSLRALPARGTSHMLDPGAVASSLGRRLATKRVPSGNQPGDRSQNACALGSSPEYRRLVDSPQFALSPQGLDRQAETIKYAEVEALLGGGTALQGAPSLAATDGLLVRNVEGTNFGRARIQSFVSPITSLAGADLDLVRGRMQSGATDAWLVHLAEGVRDADRRPGDPVSSHEEFATLKGKGLLSDTTVVIHGLALEAADFAEMRAAPSARLDGTGDGLGAKLVWSPLSNLLLYGHTAQVYDALAADVLVSLGTDWTPSGSRNLLGELKVADVTLRASSLLGSNRALVPELSVEGKHGHEAREAERALDRLLVDMVTRNPAKTVRWYDKVGSIEAGKTADLFVLTPPRRARRTRTAAVALPRPDRRDRARRPRSCSSGASRWPATPPLMKRFKNGDYETVASACRCYEKGVDVTKEGVPKGDQTLAFIRQTLEEALNALGGDRPAGGRRSRRRHQHLQLPQAAHPAALPHDGRPVPPVRARARGGDGRGEAQPRAAHAPAAAHG